MYEGLIASSLGRVHGRLDFEVDLKVILRQRTVAQILTATYIFCLQRGADNFAATHPNGEQNLHAPLALCRRLDFQRRSSRAYFGCQCSLGSICKARIVTQGEISVQAAGQLLIDVVFRVSERDREELDNGSFVHNSSRLRGPSGSGDSHGRGDTHGRAGTPL